MGEKYSFGSQKASELKDNWGAWMQHGLDERQAKINQISEKLDAETTESEAKVGLKKELKKLEEEKSSIVNLQKEGHFNQSRGSEDWEKLDFFTQTDDYKGIQKEAGKDPIKRIQRSLEKLKNGSLDDIQEKPDKIAQALRNKREGMEFKKVDDLKKDSRLLDSNGNINYENNEENVLKLGTKNEREAQVINNANSASNKLSTGKFAAGATTAAGIGGLVTQVKNSKISSRPYTAQPTINANLADKNQANNSNSLIKSGMPATEDDDVKKAAQASKAASASSTKEPLNSTPDTASEKGLKVAKKYWWLGPLLSIGLPIITILLMISMAIGAVVVVANKTVCDDSFFTKAGIDAAAFIGGKSDQLDEWRKLCLKQVQDFCSSTTVRGEYGEAKGTVKENECERVKKLWPFFQKAGEKYDIDPFILAAIASRETHMGYLTGTEGNICGGVGDNGHGRGIMQIDDRSHQVWLNSTDWQDCENNIMKGAEVLRSMADTYTGGNASDRQALNSYNAGSPCKDGTDSCTTGDDYGTNVLSRAADILNCIGSGADGVASEVCGGTIESEWLEELEPGNYKVLNVPYINQWLPFSDDVAKWSSVGGLDVPVGAKGPGGHVMCGGASSLMIASYFGGVPERNPEKLQEYLYKDNGQGLNASCNVPPGINGAAGQTGVTGAFAVTGGDQGCRQSSGPGMEAYLNHFGINFQHIPIITIESIKQSIDEGNPLIYNISNPGHIMVIIGYTNDGKIIVNDPYTNLAVYGRKWHKFNSGYGAIYTLGQFGNTGLWKTYKQ